MKANLTTIFVTLMVLVFTTNIHTEEVTIMFIGDTHSCLSPGGPRNNDLSGTEGGIAKAASVLKGVYSEDPEALLLHSGDISIGDLFFNKYFAVPELTLLKQLGADALTLGNHEFDLTPAVLQMSIEAAFADGSFPLLSTNFETFDNPELDGLKKFISPYHIQEANGVKIGIFGLTTPETNFMSSPGNVFIDTLIVERAVMTVMELQANECDIIIMLSHLGLKYDQAIAYYAEGIDLIIGGHDHFKFEEEIYVPCSNGAEVPYFQCGSAYKNIGQIKLEYDGNEISSLDYTLIALDESIPEDPEIKAVVDGMIVGIEDTFGPMYSQQVATATDFFEESGIPENLDEENLETPVGKLICEAFLQYGQTDIAIEPGGSTAQPLHNGPLVADDIFRMMGYGFNEFNALGFRMAKYKMQGMYLVQGLEFGLSEVELNDDYLIQAGGLSYTCNLNNEPYNRLTSVLVGGEPIEMEKYYSITSNEFVVLFLDFLGLPYTDLEINEELTEFEVVLSYISGLGVISAVEDKYKTGRIEEGFNIYPNPCLESTNVTFNVDAPGFYNLRMYNINGLEIYSGSDSYLEPGDHIYRLDLNRFPNGKYICVLQGNGYSIIGHFIVSR